MKRAHKYNAIKSDCPNCATGHPSRKEAKRCADLHLLQRAREIAELRTQAAFPLFGPAGLPLMSAGRASGTHRQQLKMTWDFAYTDARGSIVEDSKGIATPEFKLRRSVFEACYPSIITVVS